jgi:hypothetical protein
MTMEAQPSQDGRTRLSLGPVERWIVTIFAAAIVYSAYWLVGSVQSMLTQQQVANQQMLGMQQQLQTINTQLADVPALKLELAKLAIKVEQQEQDLKEQRQLRGIK